MGNKVYKFFQESELQVLMANIDFAFVWVVIALFLLFNVAYWAVYQWSK